MRSPWELLQWGHGDEAVEEEAGSEPRGRISDRFNGATAMKPWKSQCNGPAAGRGQRFNGATAMKPWKR